MTTPNISLLNCDCMELLQSLPDKSIDICIADPPYGIGISANPVRQKHKKRNGTTQYQLISILSNFLE